VVYGLGNHIAEQDLPVTYDSVIARFTFTRDPDRHHAVTTAEAISTRIAPQGAVWPSFPPIPAIPPVNGSPKWSPAAAAPTPAWSSPTAEQPMIRSPLQTSRASDGRTRFPSSLARAQRAAPGRHLHSLREQKPALARRDEAPRGGVRSMDDADARPPRLSVDYLTVVREWIWRHTSQPNGDPWNCDPEHLDWAALNLVDDLAQLLGTTDPPPANAHAPTADKFASRPSVAQIVWLRSRGSAAGLAAHLHKGYEYGKQRCTAHLRYVVQRNPGRRVKTCGGALA
jgi:hypothetical protein